MTRALVALLALAACSDGVARPASVTASPLLGGNGYVVREAGEPDRFCERRFETAVANPPPPECLHGMPVVGVDYERLEHKHARGSVSWRIGWLEGHVREGTFHVVRQGPWRVRPHEPLAVPESCEAPAGGWPARRPDPVAVRTWAEREPAAFIAERTGTDPRDPRRFALVVATYDAAAAEAALREAYGDALCVVPSRHTREQVASAREAARAFSDFPHVVDDGTDDGMQPTLTVNVAMVGEKERAFAASQPEGLVVFDPWLAPVDA